MSRLFSLFLVSNKFRRHITQPCINIDILLCIKLFYTITTSYHSINLCHNLFDIGMNSCASDILVCCLVLTIKNLLIFSYYMNVFPVMLTLSSCFYFTCIERIFEKTYCGN